MITQMTTDICFAEKNLSILEHKMSKNLKQCKDHTNFVCAFETKKDLKYNFYNPRPEEIGFCMLRLRHLSAATFSASKPFSMLEKPNA